MLRILAKRGALASWSSMSAVQIRRDYCSLPDGVDRNSEAMDLLISDLQSQIQKVLAGGAVKRNRSRNKLLPREKIDCLCILCDFVTLLQGCKELVHFDVSACEGFDGEFEGEEIAKLASHIAKFHV